MFWLKSWGALAAADRGAFGAVLGNLRASHTPLVNELLACGIVLVTFCLLDENCDSPKRVISLKSIGTGPIFFKRFAFAIDMDERMNSDQRFHDVVIPAPVPSEALAFGSAVIYPRGKHASTAYPSFPYAYGVDMSAQSSVKNRLATYVPPQYRATSQSLAAEIGSK